MLCADASKDPLLVATDSEGDRGCGRRNDNLPPIKNAEIRQTASKENRSRCSAYPSYAGYEWLVDPPESLGLCGEPIHSNRAESIEHGVSKRCGRLVPEDAAG